MSLLTLIGFASTTIIIILAGLSIWSVSIMLERYRYLKALQKEESFEELKKIVRENSVTHLKTKVSPSGTRSQMLSSILSNPNPEAMEHAYQSFLSDHKKSFERGFTVLGSLGSNAPFIGLLGTVLGVVKAFWGLAESQSGNAQVMAAIAEALLHTALGLFVAIPAVMAFNYFVRKLQLFLAELDSLKDLCIQQYYKDHGR